MSSEIKHICFDLDGTLLNSAGTIYKSTLKTFEDLNIEYNLPENEFYNMIGMHFIDIFEHFKINVPSFETFINHYKKIYFDFIDESVFYSGVKEVLNSIKENSYKISLLTTKAQDQTEKILEHFSITEYFDFIMGRNNGIPHKPDPTPFLMICNNLKTKPEDSLIVGDTELDILCGKNANAKTVAVTYGYRSVEKLKEFSPDFIIDDLRKLKNILKI
ncbi:MAG: HAD-IA family hydrolase [Ignavibacterium sp.]|nr:HAD-IA family hydrolase [Ignavibacterium sp.]